MFLLSKPNENQIRAFIETEKNLQFSYSEIGQTHDGKTVAGYNNDFNYIELGRGETAWEAAKNAVHQWKMFPGGWAFVAPKNTPIQEGEVVAMAAKVLGTWWLNSCRIVYVLDNERQFGFAYGTLPGHAERGEELFLVEKDDNGTVWYRLRAFSWPRHWLARLGYPVARMYQRKFVRDSKKSMLEIVQKSTSRT